MGNSRILCHQDEPGYGDPNTFYSTFHDRLPCGDAEGLAKYIHKTMERPYHETDEYERILEVGAGTGTHLKFVKHAFSSYVLTDVRQESVDAAKARHAGDPRVSYAVADAQDLHFEDGSFDRLVATCLLIHLLNPENALGEWRRVVRRNGVVTIYVPNEGALLHTLRRLTTARAARRLGFRGYDLCCAREHMHRSRALDSLVRYTFRRDHLECVGWPVHPSPQAARLFTVYQATILG